MPDKDVRNCSKCSRKFNIYLRKHHCRLCSWIFCKHCSSLKMRKVDGIVEKVRMCIECDIIQQQYMQSYRNNKKIL